MKKTIIVLLAVFISLTTFAQNDQPKADSTQQAYSCPMHADVKGTATSKCSKCGMALTLTKTYVCPMHAEITSSDKKAKCTKCGMGLVEAKPKKG